MNENLHPGHKILREVCPESEYRQLVVAALCNVSGVYDTGLSVGSCRRTLSNWQVSVTPEQAEQIAAFINSI